MVSKTIVKKYFCLIFIPLLVFFIINVEDKTEFKFVGVNNESLILVVEEDPGFFFPIRSVFETPFNLKWHRLCVEELDTTTFLTIVNQYGSGIVLTNTNPDIYLNVFVDGLYQKSTNLNKRKDNCIPINLEKKNTFTITAGSTLTISEEITNLVGNENLTINSFIKQGWEGPKLKRHWLTFFTKMILFLLAWWGARLLIIETFKSK